MGLLETKQKDNLYVFFRVCVGALFFALGVQKLFGLWGMPGGAAVFNTLIWWAGALEFVIGAGLIVGAFTRLLSAVGILEMIIAYYLGHVAATGTWNPTMNMGMPALVFGLAFVVTLAYGAGKFSLEKKVMGKELF